MTDTSRWMELVDQAMGQGAQSPGAVADYLMERVSDTTPEHRRFFSGMAFAYMSMCTSPEAMQLLIDRTAPAPPTLSVVK